MRDIQSVYVLDTVPVTSVELLSSEPFIIEVHGQDFGNISFVEINNLLTEHTVISEILAHVTVPESIAGTPLEAINIFSKSATITTKASMFSFELGPNPTTITGPAKLLNQILKVIMTSPGSDIDNSAVGGDLQNLSGGRVSSGSKYSLTAKAAMMISSVSQQVVSAQRRSNLPRREKLRDIELLSINYDESNPSIIDLDIRINTLSGESVRASVGMDN